MGLRESGWFKLCFIGGKSPDGVMWRDKGIDAGDD